MEELKDALNAKTVKERENYAAMMMVEEGPIQDKGFLRPPKSAQRAELEDQLLQLRELQYIVRYGDYVKIIPTRLKLHASKHKSESRLILGNDYWSRIAVTVEEEEKARKEADDIGGAHVSMPTTGAIYAACADLGISEELAIWSIKEYGRRNRKVHRDLDDLKREGEFPLLASILCADRDELSSTFSSVNSETDLSYLKTIIQSEIDTFFEDTNDFPNQPAAWVPSIALRQFYKDAINKATKPSRHEIKQANIARFQRKSEEKAARQKEASTGNSLIAGKERIASTEGPRGSELERQERTRQQRVKLLAKKCKLEEDIKRIDRELDLLNDGNDVSPDEQNSEGDIS